MSILLTEETTFIVQGITGREAVNLTRECLDYGAGARIVGGVTPGRLGRDVHGVPVVDTVAQAVDHNGGPIDGSVVTVPPAFTKDAVFEAIENGVRLVVIVTERIPRADVAEMVELADARGVIKACLELGMDPAEKIAIFRIPGAWEEEGFKILEKYGIEYADRSVSMHEAARRAVEKIQGVAA